MNKILLFCGCLAVLITSCVQDKPTEPTPPKLIELKYNTSHEEDGMRINFSAVTSDSRCPSGEQCSWQGNAEIVLELTGDGNQAAVLNTNPQYQQSYPYNDRTITLKELKPYPETGQPVAMDSYIAVLSIEK
ncbi:hypothetical protein [Candidatus Electronema sp. PJ]|uniref:hypothetical protein n=1 Tax=Candidatus Electronema sp. PJ TaxID=3401572 RepID=UPI003AA85BBA